MANYVPFVLTGKLLFVSGQVCIGLDGKLADTHKGKLGAEISLEDGQLAARLCAIQLLAQAKAALGDHPDEVAVGVHDSMVSAPSAKVNRRPKRILFAG